MRSARSRAPRPSSRMRCREWSRLGRRSGDGASAAGPAPGRAGRAAADPSAHRGAAHAGAASVPPDRGRADRALAAPRPARLRDRRRSRDGAGHRAAVRARREPRVDRARRARPPRSGRLGTRLRRGPPRPRPVRPAPRGARGRGSRHGRGLRDARGGVGALRPRARRTRAPARRRDRCADDRGRARVGLADPGGHRARRLRARAGAPGDRHGHDSRRGGLCGDRARSDSGDRREARLGAAAGDRRRDRRRADDRSHRRSGLGGGRRRRRGRARARGRPPGLRHSPAPRPRRERPAPAGSDPAAGRDGHRTAHGGGAPRGRDPIAGSCSSPPAGCGPARGSRSRAATARSRSSWARRPSPSSPWRPQSSSRTTR